MPAVTIRNLSDETHRALRVRAAHHGRSTEADIRDIIEVAARPPERVKLGSLLMAIGRAAELSDSDVDALQKSRDKTPAEPMTFQMILLGTNVISEPWKPVSDEAVIACLDAQAIERFSSLQNDY